jgi:TetR/AcrR family tetracycline transcriptional repressor
MTVTRDDVIHTAIQLLQEVGLDGLTLRRLATELGISAPTLYWHVRDKRELLDEMAETMVRDFRDQMPPFPANLEWWEKIAEGMRRQYQALISYRDGARVVAGNRPTESSLPMIDNYLQIWVDAGFPPEEALATILSFGDFVTGAALEYQAEIERDRESLPETRRKAWQQMTAYPNLRAAAEGRRRQRQHGDHKSQFEHGLGLLIRGLRERQKELAAQAGQQAGARS